MKKILSIIYIYNIDIESKIENKKINKIISIFLKVKSKIKNKKIKKIISIFLKITFVLGIIILYFYFYIKNFKSLEIFDFIYNILYIDNISSNMITILFGNSISFNFLCEKINLQDYKKTIKNFKKIYEVKTYEKRIVYGLDNNKYILYKKDFEKIEKNKDLIKKKILKDESFLFFLLSLQNRKDLIKLFEEMKNQIWILLYYLYNKEINSNFLENIEFIENINDALEKIPLNINTDSYQEYINLLDQKMNFENIKDICKNIKDLLNSIQENYKNTLYTPILELIKFLSNESNHIINNDQNKQNIKNIIYIFFKNENFYSSLLKMLENKNNEQNNQEEKKKILENIKSFYSKKFKKLNSICCSEDFCFFPT